MPVRIQCLALAVYCACREDKLKRIGGHRHVGGAADYDGHAIYAATAVRNNPLVGAALGMLCRPIEAAHDGGDFRLATRLARTLRSDLSGPAWPVFQTNGTLGHLTPTLGWVSCLLRTIARSLGDVTALTRKSSRMAIVNVALLRASQGGATCFEKPRDGLRVQWRLAHHSAAV